jgi:predicted HTH domain antitoxin
LPTAKGKNMQILQIQLPDFINIDTQEIQMLLASKLYEKGVLSVGQAAQMAGLSKRTFMELLGRYQVSVLNYPAEDITQDFENA